MKRYLSVTLSQHGIPFLVEIINNMLKDKDHFASIKQSLLFIKEILRLIFYHRADNAVSDA